jgi:hypothetical protein
MAAPVLGHAEDCSGLCGGMWLAVQSPGCLPYPCLCEELDPHPLDWKVERARRSGQGSDVYLCDPYIHKGSGQWRIRCSCWGQKPDGRPEGCCAHHEGNPRYWIIIDGLRVTPDGPVPAAHTAPLSPAERYAAPPAPSPLPDLLHPPEPYRPRWTREELHCACPTPWDDDSRSSGFHCSNDGCHTNWRNLGAARQHFRQLPGGLWRCVAPETLRDVGPGPTTGQPTVRARYEGAHVVWG